MASTDAGSVETTPNRHESQPTRIMHGDLAAVLLERGDAVAQGRLIQSHPLVEENRNQVVSEMSV